MLDGIESVIDPSMEGDALLTEIRRIRQEFELHQDLSEEIADKDVLNKRLERLKYAELLASQPDSEPPVEEVLQIADVRADAGNSPTGAVEDDVVEDAAEGAPTDQQQP